MLTGVPCMANNLTV